MAEKSLLVKAFSPVLDDFKFSQKDTVLYYSSDEKHNGDIAEPVWPTVLGKGPYSVQEGVPEPPKMAPAQSPQRIQIRRPRKTPIAVDSIKQGDFDNLKMLWRNYGVTSN